MLSQFPRLDPGGCYRRPPAFLPWVEEFIHGDGDEVSGINLKISLGDTRVPSLGS